MKLIGRRGEFSFYRQEGYLDLLNYLPYINPDHIIAGGAPLAILQESRKYKDIDIWVSGDIPEEAKQESQFAYNYMKTRRGPNVQYMKVRATTPSALLNTFDIDACKCAFYNITEKGYDVCIHKYLKPLVYGKNIEEVCGVNPNAYNSFSVMRFHKYALKFGKSPLDMFTNEDYAMALHHSEFSGMSPQEITEAIDKWDGGDQYDLIDHLRGLFEPTDAQREFFGTSHVAYSTPTRSGIFASSNASVWGSLGIPTTDDVDWSRLATRTTRLV